MDCDRMKEWLEPYAAGQLTGEPEARLKAHLEACPACAKELRWAMALKASVRAQPRPALPKDLRDELMRQAAAAGRVRWSFPGWLDSLRFSWRLAAGFGLASACAAAAGLLFFSRFATAGSREISLDEVLAAHSRYRLTMPAADRDGIFADLGPRLAEGGGHD